METKQNMHCTEGGSTESLQYVSLFETEVFSAGRALHSHRSHSLLCKLLIIYDIIFFRVHVLKRVIAYSTIWGLLISIVAHSLFVIA